MERTYLKPGDIIAPIADLEEFFEVLKVYDYCGTMWVDVVKKRYCLPLTLDEVQKKYEVVYRKVEDEE
ncbi:MAG: hypothetical protein Q4F00_14295 [bacterium]|nr:hypothetical protein [bacterium]